MESLYPFDSPVPQETGQQNLCPVQSLALSSTAQEALWLREVNKDLKNPPSEPTIIFEDNQLAICMSKNPQFHGRSKHIYIKFHFIRE